MVAAAVFCTATYAWFSVNRNVAAGRIETSTDTVTLTLYVKAPTDSAFSGNTCDLRFTAGNELALLPVSSADLQHFVYCPSMTASVNAERFAPIADPAAQDKFCYGAIDMRADLSGATAKRVAVYLDESGELGKLAQKLGEDSLLLNAARLGIMVKGDPETAKIFFLSDQNNAAGQQIRNTVVNGQPQGDNIVLKSDASGNVTPVEDPARPLSACMISDGADAREPLFYLQPGVDYQIQVFFYLEGCDPDCSNSIQYHASDFGLAFYATLAPEG